MTGKTHFTASILTISSTCIVLNNPLHIALFAAGNFYGALVPDIDVNNSIGRHTFPLTSKVYDFFHFFLTMMGVDDTLFSHRGIMHSLFIPIIFFIAANKNTTIFSYFLSGLFIGYITHLILDFITSGKKGLALLSPIINYRFKLPIYIKTNGFFESITFQSMEILSLFIILFFTKSGLQVFSI